MATKRNFEHFRKIRIPVEARQHLEEYRGIPVIDAFYTAGWVQEKDGTFQRYLLPTTHREAIVLDGGAVNYRLLRGNGVDSDPARLLLLTGNSFIQSKPEIYVIGSSKENDQYIEYGVDLIDFRIAHGILGGLGLFRKHGELSKADLQFYVDGMGEFFAELERNGLEQYDRSQK